MGAGRALGLTGTELVLLRVVQREDTDGRVSWHGSTGFPGSWLTVHRISRLGRHAHNTR
jgi:hypothetical protein